MADHHATKQEDSATTPSQQVPVIVSLDIGSSSVKCSAYEHFKDEPPQWIDTVQRPFPSVQPVTGHINLQVCRDDDKEEFPKADHDSLDRTPTLLLVIDACMDQLLEPLDASRYRVVAVGFSSFVMNFVGLDAQGGVITSLSYACNIDEAHSEVERIKQQLGSEEAVQQLYQRTGAPLHAAYALPQLTAFYAHSPEAAISVEAWETLASWIVNRWTTDKRLPPPSRMCISYSEASWTGLLNLQTCQYEPMALRLLPEACLQALPPLGDYDSCSRSISRDNPYWNRWPSLRQARFFYGVGDGACANVGSKCRTRARIACTIGTSAAARVIRSLPIVSEITEKGSGDLSRVPPGLFCYRVNRSHVLLGGALTDGGSVMEWIKQLLNLNRDESLWIACLKQVDDLYHMHIISSSSSANELTMVPFLGGERSTGFRSGATGAVLGLTRETTRAHLVLACLQGVTLRLAAIVRLLLLQLTEASTSPTPPQIIASGKALEVNELWRQMIADATGLEVVFDGNTQQGTSRGVACLVSTALARSEHPPHSEAVDTPEFLVDEPIQSFMVSKPNKQAQDYWQRAVGAQDQFIDAISPLYGQTSTGG